MDSEEEFKRIEQEIINYYAERYPALATQLGLHQYDSLMSDGSYEAKLREIEKAKEFRRRVEELDPEGLEPERRLDREMCLKEFDLSLFVDEVLRFWQSIPAAPSGVGGSLFVLFTRDFAPLKERMKSIISRLEKCPDYVEQTKSRLKRLVKLWTEMAIEAAESTPMFLNTILGAGRNVLEKEELLGLESAVAETLSSIREHENWLKEEILPVAVEQVGIGEDRLRQLIEMRDLGMDLEDIYELGKGYLEKERRELESLARQINPTKSVSEVIDMVKSVHPPNFQEVLKEYRESIKEAREFVLSKRIATIPENESILVTETPSYARHVIPFAAYIVPGKFEKKQMGEYLVTPVEDRPEMLKEHCYAGIRNTSVHEAYPGHHLQLSCANMNPSLCRVMMHAVEVVEGWAHYCEDMMKEYGFETSLEAKLIETVDRVWRAARIIVDIDLHRGRMSFDEAVDFLVDQTGMARAAAIAEVKRYTQNPGYQLSYLLGKHMIMELREEVKQRMGDKYSDRFFHDTILYAGSIRMKFLRKLFDEKLKAMGC